MIGFLIFYFVFSAIFAVGIRARAHKNGIPLDEFMMGILLGWLLLPLDLVCLLVNLLVTNVNKHKIIEECQEPNQNQEK